MAVGQHDGVCKWLGPTWTHARAHIQTGERSKIETRRPQFVASVLDRLRRRTPVSQPVSAERDHDAAAVAVRFAMISSQAYMSDRLPIGTLCVLRRSRMFRIIHKESEYVILSY